MLRRLCLVLGFLCGMSAYSQEKISVAGAWELSLGDSTKYDDSVVLPGSLLTNGKGDDVTAETQWTASFHDSSDNANPYTFFLTPSKHFVGKAWYRKSVYVPQSWAGQRITLFLERPHIETTVYVNGSEVGHQMSLSTPHLYDITKFLTPGKRNIIAICVYNGIENVGVGQDSHSVTDHTQGNWNGIVGRMELRAQPSDIYINKVKVTPNLKKGSVHLDLDIAGIGQTYGLIQVAVEMVGQENQGPLIVFEELRRSRNSFDVYLGDIVIWDEFQPRLYRVGISVGNDYYETTFGMREIAVEGRQLMINKRPLFLRGTVENCCFPETGYPPMDEEEWTRILTKCKEYGLNHMRFHSYCPPEAAFVVADELGMYLQVEGPTWPNHGVRLGSGQVIDNYLMEESKRILDAYGHHPSFVMMAAGNEPAGDWVSYCNEWVKEMKKYDSSKIYCGASVGGGWAWDDGSEYHVKAGARGLDWDNHPPHADDNYNRLIDYPINYQGQKPNKSPIIAHEQGQWGAFPDFKEISQYHGAYHPKNLEIFRNLLRDNGMEQQAEKFLMASGKLQTLCYKYEIERNLRTKDYAGFQLLSLNDYSGQGTALVGPLNVQWYEKDYTSAEIWTEFCSPIVALAKFPKFVYANTDTLVVPVELYNAMYAGIKNVRNTYYITDDSMHIMAGGAISVGTLPVGKHTDIGTVRFPLSNVEKPSKLTLSVLVGGKLRNHWDFWVYPEKEDSVFIPGPSLHVTDTLDARAMDVLNKGGNVLLTAAGKVKLGSDVVQHYLPVFWNTLWFKMRPPHTTGAYIDKSHPLFKYDFPTDDWGNLNWWELLNKAQVMNLMEFPKDYQPPIQPIDTWHVSRKLGMLVEANVLKGKLLMTTMDITNDLEHRLVARQMRQAILRYMESEDFKPIITLSPQVIQNLFTKK